MSRSLRPRQTILRIKKSKHLHQGIAASLSIFIIAIIILAPTVAAITVETSGLTDGLEITNGGSFQFRIRVSINADEFVSINQLKIVLDGTEYAFNPSTGAAIPPASSAISSVTPENFASGQLYTSTYGYAYGYFLAYGYGFRPSLNNYGYGYSYGAPDTYGYGFTGARTFSYLVTLSPSSMALGSHNLRAVIETGLSPIAAFTSPTTTFSIVSGTSNSASVTGATPSVDHTATTSVAVTVSGATYIDSTIPGIITTQKFTSGVVPTTVAITPTPTGKAVAKYLDVKATNFAGGTATITVTYTAAEIVGLNEATLSLYSYSAGPPAAWTELSSITRNTVAKTISGTIPVTQLTGTVIALAASTAVTPFTPAPAVSQVTAAIKGEPLTVAPGSSTKVTLTLNSNNLINAGNVTFTLPKYLKVSNIVITNFTGTSSLTGTTLRIDKTSALDTRSLAVSFTLTAPLNSSIQVGETYSVTANAALTLSTVTFQDSNTVTLTIAKPSVASIFSALDSYFGKTTSVYTENRVPLAKDILNLLDFYFQGKV